MDSSSKHRLGEVGTELDGVVASLRAIGIPRAATELKSGIRLRKKRRGTISSTSAQLSSNPGTEASILMQPGEVHKIVVDMVAAYCRVEVSELLGKTRGEEEVALARQTVMYLLRKSFNMSFPEIGKLIGRDHTTVLHACTKLERQRTVDEAVNADLTKLEEMLSHRGHVQIVEAPPPVVEEPVEDPTPTPAEVEGPDEVVTAEVEQAGDRGTEEESPTPTEQTPLQEEASTSPEKIVRVQGKKTQRPRPAQNEFADKVNSLMSGFLEETLAQLLTKPKQKNTRRKI